MPSVTAPLMAVSCPSKGVLGNRVDSDVGAGQSACDGDPHRGGVGDLPS